MAAIISGCSGEGLDGTKVGNKVGAKVGAKVGLNDGTNVGANVGLDVGDRRRVVLVHLLGRLTGLVFLIPALADLLVRPALALEVVVVGLGVLGMLGDVAGMLSCRGSVLDRLAWLVLDLDARAAGLGRWLGDQDRKSVV